jgi:hypothetical protein
MGNAFGRAQGQPFVAENGSDKNCIIQKLSAFPQQFIGSVKLNNIVEQCSVKSNEQTQQQPQQTPVEAFGYITNQNYLYYIIIILVILVIYLYNK